ncbi:MAG: DUF92 domain-containing protein [Candidatus Eremiobacteraeota bacterium]|nr:DUF92 domain-containing protein [Candidatus Eremiobacteraeota bacterium]
MTGSDAVLGAAAAVAIAFAAYRAGALTRSGACAAFAVGALTFASGGVAFAVVLLAFFMPSIALSRLGRARKRALLDAAKPGARDAMQVLANGGVATLCAVLWALTREAHWAWAFGGAYAAATADTWATELGTLARQQPRSILTLRPVAPGLSGGITAAGTLAEIAGAAWLAVVALPCIGAAIFFQVARSAAPSVMTAGLLELAVLPLAGVAGATVDSLLGAALQELRHCDACGRDCESDPHACGAPARLVRGVRGVTNDVVNLAACATGAVVAYILT